MINARTLSVCLLTLGLLPATAGAGIRYEVEPMIWKAVHVARGETPWDACWRHFRSDARLVRSGPPGTVYCYVPYHYMYGPGQKRQNFNQ